MAMAMAATVRSKPSDMITCDAWKRCGGDSGTVSAVGWVGGRVREKRWSLDLEKGKAVGPSKAVMGVSLCCSGDGGVPVASGEGGWFTAVSNGSYGVVVA